MPINKKLYICTTNACQLHCNGCYMNSSCAQINLNKISIPFVKEAINNILPTCDTLECVFHGGEPFFYQDDLTIQTYIDLVKSYPDISWSATTNLVYTLTPKLLELFNLFTDKFIKTSWDVDTYRFKTLDQLQLWETNVKTLLNTGFLVEPLITVNTSTITHKPEEILNYFTTLGFTCLNFERITETGRAKDIKIKPTNREVDDWLFQAYIYNKNHNHFNIPLFDELEAITKGAEPLGCRKRQCMKCVTTLNTNNTFGTCPNNSQTIIGTYEGGRITYNQDVHNTLIKNEQQIDNKCLTCKFYTICHADCCQLKFDETGCPGLTQILQYITKNGSK